VNGACWVICIGPVLQGGTGRVADVAADGAVAFGQCTDSPALYHRAVATKQERRAELTAVYRRARTCTRCPQLASTRTQVVFGSGNADADLMFVGEAPGAREDEQGIPFVGAAGKLLDELLGEVGLSREDVFIANVLKCRPPGNRDPLPAEIENCSDYLLRQVELIEPRVICTLGNFATKLLRAEPTGISRLHGQAEIRVIGERAVRLYPLFHPAAALYTRSLLETLRADVARLPGLLELPLPEQPEPPAERERESEPAPAPAPVVAEPQLAAALRPAPEPAPVAEREPPDERQLGLF
jgi:uracil-DNA glycosylase